MKLDLFWGGCYPKIGESDGSEDENEINSGAILGFRGNSCRHCGP